MRAATVLLVVTMVTAMAPGTVLPVAAAAAEFTDRDSGEVVRGSLVKTTHTEEGIRILTVLDEHGKTRELVGPQWSIRLSPTANPGVPVLPPVQTTPHGPARPQGSVIEIAIRDRITSGAMVKAFRAALAEAFQSQPVVIVVGIDTPGGEIDAAEEMSSILTGIQGARVIAQVVRGKHGGAYSAGALLALSCDEIQMEDGAVIGAAAPVDGRGVPLPEKYVSAFSAKMRAVATGQGFSAALAAAMVDKNAEVVLAEVAGQRRCLFAEEVARTREQAEAGGREFRVIETVCRRGQLLTLTAAEAIRLGLAKQAKSTNEIALEVNATYIVRPGAAFALANIEKLKEEDRRRKEEAKRRTIAYLDQCYHEAQKWYGRAAESHPGKFTYTVNVYTGLFLDGGEEWRKRTDKALEAARRADDNIDRMKEVIRNTTVDYDTGPARALEVEIDRLITDLKADRGRRGLP